MQQPDFWFDEKAKKPFWSYLSFLEIMYRTALWQRQVFARPSSVPCPVICIGNMVVGGTGKTSLAIALARYFNAFGKNSHVLLRGYAGSSVTPFPMLVDHAHHTAKEVGDDAILLSRVAPTWIGANRYKSACAALERKANIILMDDGFQNFSLSKDISLLLVDGVDGIGNGKIVPFGPLREPVSSSLARASAIIMIDVLKKCDDNKNSRQKKFLDKILDDATNKYNLPVFFMQRVLSPPPVALKRRVIVYSGIGGSRSRLLNSIYCSNLNVRVIDYIYFNDHHIFTEEDAHFILKRAKEKKAILLTTQKDYVRLTSLVNDGAIFQKMHQESHVINVELEMDDWSGFEDFLSQSLIALGDDRSSSIGSLLLSKSTKTQASFDFAKNKRMDNKNDELDPFDPEFIHQINQKMIDSSQSK